MPVENPNTKKLFFKKILRTLMVKRTKEESKGLVIRGHRGGRKVDDALYFLNSRCSLCSLWLDFDNT
jgi:hypothetical protein